MTKSILMLTPLFLLSTANAQRPEASLLSKHETCLMLMDQATGKFLVKHGGARCSQRFAPASTFKVPLALMAFEEGILADLDTVLPWDGRPGLLKSWERDHNSKSWMKHSVVWFSRILTQRMGRQTIEGHLRKWSYGNADMTGGLESSWLTRSPNNKGKISSSVAISPEEQLRFFSRLWKEELPVSSRSLELTRGITFIEKSPQGFDLHGKTGSGYVDEQSTRRMGWFLGRLSKDQQEYIGVVNFSDKQIPPPGSEYAGPEARRLFLEAAQAKGIW